MTARRKIMFAASVFFVCVAGHSDVCFYLVTARFTVAIVDVHVSKEELV